MQKQNLLSLLTCLLLLSYAGKCQPKSDKVLQEILQENKNDVLQEILHDATTYRCQIIYTQINRDNHNVPHFKNYYFNYDPLLYFNPASTVKMPLAFLSLEKLHSMRSTGIDKFKPLQIDSSCPWQKV